MSQFHISDENPNDTVGGKGCLCHPRGSDETKGPFVIFTPTTTDDNLSPHAVLCEHCVGECGIALTPDVPPTIDGEYEEITDLDETITHDAEVIAPVIKI